LVLLAFLVRDRILDWSGGQLVARGGNAVAAEDRGGGGADHEKTGQRNDRDGSRQKGLHFRRPTLLVLTRFLDANRYPLRSKTLSTKNWMPIKALACRPTWSRAPKNRKSRQNRKKSGRGGQIIGFLDVGHDIGRLPERVGRDRAQADGPVAFAVARHADD